MYFTNSIVLLDFNYLKIQKLLPKIHFTEYWSMFSGVVNEVYGGSYWNVSDSLVVTENQSAPLIV